MCVLRSQFLYIVVLHQLQLVELGRFTYYLDCDCTFDLFNCIEVYSCEAQLLLSQLIFKSHLRPVELYSSCHEVKNSLVNLLCSMPRDLLQIYSHTILKCSNCEENHTANSNICEFKTSIENKSTKYSQNMQKKQQTKS